MAEETDTSDDLRHDIESLWEQWPERKRPRSDTTNMFNFYSSWLDNKRPDIARFNEWEKVRGWLVDYEELHGRSIYHKGY